jgi:NRAMP (natural resistance-associated macrophage protein)-like metal ion transporter
MQIHGSSEPQPEAFQEQAEPSARTREIQRQRNPLRRFLRTLGPGLVTGASDDDPSGIATYAIAGASLGFATLWTALLTFPLMAAVQGICARIGLVSGRGLAGVLCRRSPRLAYVSLVLLLIANIINIGADLGAIADAVGLLAGVAVPWLVLPIALGLLSLQVLGRYRVLADTLKWLCLVLLVYVIDVFMVQPPLAETVRASFTPVVSTDHTYLTTLVAILGTTISPYLFFWQATQEIEEQRDEGKLTVASRKGAAEADIHYAQVDVNAGMLLSNVVMYSIILATASTLFKEGKHDIQTAADAAKALEPIAGSFAEALFALGMIGTGLLAVPVLSGSAAHALAELFHWKSGFDEPFAKAPAFYLVIIGATLAGTALNFIGIPPMEGLYWAAVINGVLAPPLLVLVMLSARDPKVMGEHRIGTTLTILGWTATVAMFLALFGLCFTSV